MKGNLNVEINRRDYFAATALQVLLEKFDPTKYDINAIARDSYAVADAMVSASAK
jgi:hypothetical protein